MAAHRRTQALGQQLRSKADPENEHSVPQTLNQKLFLIAEPTILGLVMNAHRPAHDDKQVEVANAGKRFGLEKPEYAKLVTALYGPFLDRAWTFKRSVCEAMNSQSS